MSDVKERVSEDVRKGSDCISLPELAELIGQGPAEEFFERIDQDSRFGDVIVGTNVRQARTSFSKVHTPGHAQLVVPGRSPNRRGSIASLSDSVVIMRMEDLEAVVQAAHDEFSWIDEFSPRPGLAAATKSPVLKRGSRGRRQLRA